MKKKYLHIILISSQWDKSHRIGFYEHIESCFSKWSKVVFVESPYSFIFHFFKNFKKVLKLFISKKTKYQAGDINILRILILFHIKLYKWSDILNRIDSYIISRRIKYFKGKYFRDHKIILWVHHPSNIFIALNLKPDILVYDYYDNFGYDSSGYLEEKNFKNNNKILGLCDLIICTANVMYRQALEINKNSYLITNGFENSVFNEEKINLLNNCEIIGYLGNIRDWIDFELVKKLILKLKENQYLYFIGPVEKNVSDKVDDLKRCSNFRHLEKIPFQKTGAYLKAFNVGIIPFKINKFMEGVMPNKFFEYIAAGIPVVTTALPDVIQYSDIINVAHSIEEFTEFCINQNYLKFFNPGKYKEILSKSKWDDKADEVNRLLISVIQKKENYADFVI